MKHADGCSEHNKYQIKWFVLFLSMVDSGIVSILVYWYNIGDFNIKGLLHPKMKILSLITYPMLFQTRKSFIRLQNTI